MPAERWQRAKDVFGRASELPPAARGVFVSRACGEDRALRRQIESLLSADDDAGTFLERPLDPAALPPPIGGYRFIRKIGSGGMSQVFLAIQSDEKFKRRVAFKMLRQSLASGDQRQRLCQERQILASLDHPNIARLYAAGSTEDGRPYVVLELVDGEPITDYCDRHRLSIDQRIELFRTVCAAVHYAHQNLVVHRDLKASNILVTASGCPKLLDFGIAKILNPELSAQGPDPTVPWRRFLTPELASPEQLLGTSITTASDVYSLGVLLYQLTTGSRPLKLDGMTPDQVERTVAEQRPRLASEAAARASKETAHQRALSIPQLSRRLAGDIDTIIAKTLRKSPHHRYGSAAELAEDLRRHRVGLPVIARRPTAGYRLRRFLRRNRLSVAITAAFISLLVAASVGLGFASLRLAAQRQRAEVERDKARQVVRFIEDIFEVADPKNPAAASVAARDVLDRAARRVEENLGQRPALRAALMKTMGAIYTKLGLYPASRHQLEDALTILEHDRDARPLDIADTLADLATAQAGEGMSDEAAASLGQALRVLTTTGEEDPIERASVLAQAALVAEELGQYAEAQSLSRASLALRLAHLDPRSLEVAQSRYALALTLYRLGHFEASESEHRQALAIRREHLGSDNLEVSTSLNGLANTLKKLGKYDEAERLLDQALAINRKRLGLAHSDTLATLNNLASLATYRKDFANAARRYAEALEVARPSLGNGHPNLAFLLLGLGRARAELGDAVHAEPALREALAIRRRAYPPGHPLTAVAEAILGDCLLRLERFAAAESLLLSSYRVISALEPRRTRLLHGVTKDLAALYRRTSRDELVARYEAEMKALEAIDPTLR